jgi:site-specific recombinase XerC
MFHTFRHTCASLLFEAARDVKQVAEWLGDAARRFTLGTYVHLMDEGVGDAAFMDDILAAVPAAAHRKLRTTVAFRPKRPLAFHFLT